LEQGSGVFGEDAGSDFYLVIEFGMSEDFETRADGAALGVVGAVDEARDAGLDHGTGAHGARFDGDVESGTGEAVVFKDMRGSTHDNNLRVGGGVAVANGAIAGAGEDLAVMHQDGADRHFASGRCGARLSQGFSHGLEIGFHVVPEDNMRGVGELT